MSNVIPLFQADPSKSDRIRLWFMEQGMEPVGHLAAVSVAITADGMVKSKGCGVAEEHAPVILGELKAMVASIEAVVASRSLTSSSTRGACQVIRLARRA